MKKDINVEPSILLDQIINGKDNLNLRRENNDNCVEKITFESAVGRVFN